MTNTRSNNKPRRRRSGGTGGSGGSQLVFEPLVPLGARAQVIDPVSSGSQVVLSGSRTTGVTSGSLPLGEVEPPVTGKNTGRLTPRSDRGSYHPIGGDVRALPAEHWGQLPLPATLACLDYSSVHPVVLTTSRPVWRALIGLRRAVFGVMEWAELVSAYWDDRANPASFVRWCEYKRVTPAWRLSRREATGAIGDSKRTPALASVGAVMDAWGIELCAVHYGAEVPQ